MTCLGIRLHCMKCHSERREESLGCNEFRSFIIGIPRRDAPRNDMRPVVILRCEAPKNLVVRIEVSYEFGKRDPSLHFISPRMTHISEDVLLKWFTPGLR